MKKNSKIFLIFITIVVLFISVVDVRAVAYTNDIANNGTQVCFDKTTGNFVKSWTYASGGSCSGYGWDAIKLIEGNYAFCVNWNKHITHAGDWQKVSDWSTKDSVITGLILKNIGSRGYSTEKAYTLKGATLNTYFSRNVPNYKSGSLDFYTTNSEIKSVIDTAINTYNKNTSLYNINNKNLPSVSFSVNNDQYTLTENESNDGYISEKITANLVASYGSAISYKIKISSSVGTVGLCSNATDDLANCKTSDNIPAGTSSYSFYIKTLDDAADSKITITIEGSNSYTFPYTELYYNTSYTNYQKLLVEKTKSVNRTSSNDFVFIVPKDTTGSGISVIKSTGSLVYLGGADLKLARNGYSSSNYLDAIGTGSIMVYTDDTPDFFDQTYYIVEEKVPTGYIKNKPFKFYSGTRGPGLYCYDMSNGNLLDSKSACWMDRYSYMCKASDDSGYFELSDLNNCSLDSKTNYNKVCYDKSSEKEVNEKYCSGTYSLVVQAIAGDDVGQVKVYFGNKKNKVSISKNDGVDEVAGAKLKICSATEYNTNKENCTSASTIDKLELEWISNAEPAVFEGLAVGSYYVMEVEPPAGYVKTNSVVEFSIDEYGVVTSDGKKLDDGVVSITNRQNSLSISKQDVATSKELPGATISICETYVENNEVNFVTGKYDEECVVAVLSDGSEATWVSTDEPKVLEGLPAGTYALVEKIAPNGYSTAESIIFTMNDDGTLTDKDGNSLEDNKLVMKDEKIKEVKTGLLPVFIVFGIVIVVGGLGIGSYYYVKRTSNVVNDNSNDKKNKIRKRKIHKK